MTTFTIDADNSITAFGTKQEADGAQGESFCTQQELAELAGKWPANRLVEVWNGIPGLTTVKKFTNRKSALARIWKAIQSLNGDSAVDAASSASKRPAKAAQARKPVKKTARSAKNKPPKAGKGKGASLRPSLRPSLRWPATAARKLKSSRYSSGRAVRRWPRS